MEPVDAMVEPMVTWERLVERARVYGEKREDRMVALENAGEFMASVLALCVTPDMSQSLLEDMDRALREWNRVLGIQP